MESEYDRIMSTRSGRKGIFKSEIVLRFIELKIYKKSKKKQKKYVNKLLKRMRDQV
jgi:hypothetical protein